MKKKISVKRKIEKALKDIQDWKQLSHIEIKIYEDREGNTFGFCDLDHDKFGEIGQFAFKVPAAQTQQPQQKSTQQVVSLPGDIRGNRYGVVGSR